ncbi:MAG: glycosyltransferase family 39 protein [Planctomycetota bacterium]
MNASAEGARGRTTRDLVVLFAIFTVVKLVVLSMPPEEISPGGLPVFEEWRRGMCAREWLVGPLLPLMEYQQGHFQGGTLLTIGLGTLSFALFGESPLTMRLPNLLYDLSTIGFLYLFVLRVASRRAARIAGLLAAVPSPGYLMVGAVVWTSHVEANAFAMALLWFWTRHVFDGRGGPRGAFLLGVLAGLSFWFHYGLLIWLVLMLLVEVVRDRRAWIRPAMGIRVAGFAIGLAPWWVYNATHGWKGLGVYGKSASAHFQTSSEEIVETVGRLVSHFLPHSAFLPHWGGAGRALELALFALAIAAWLSLTVSSVRALARDREVRPELVVAAYPLLWSVLYVFGTFHGQDRWVSGYRYMLPLHPVGWFCVGVLLARAPRAFAHVVVAASLAVFAVGTAHYLRPDHARINATAPGYHTESIGRFLFLRAGEDPDALVAAMERVVAEREPMEADVVLFTLGNCMLFAARIVPNPRKHDADQRVLIEERRARHRATLDALRQAAPPRYAPYFDALRSGERAWKWPERDRFWRQWDLRGEPRPEGAYAH